MVSGALLLGFVTFTWCVEPFVFGVEFVGLLEDPTISIGMVCRLPGSTVDLAYLVQVLFKLDSSSLLSLRGSFFDSIESF